jgi:hypothetical protein
MMISREEYIELGPVPAMEDCAQTGEPDFRKRAMAEGARYIELLKEKFPNPPMGCDFRLKSFNHDFGQYFEVVVTYNTTDKESEEFAFNVERNLPETWEG